MGSAAATSVKLNASRMIAALHDRTLPELQQQWLNVNEKLAKAETDELLRFRGAVMAEWERRYHLAVSDPDRFEWPSTSVNPGDGAAIRISRNAEGMLSYLGYRVGVTKGLTENTRRRILDGIFAGGLPPLNGPEYVKGWAAPRSAPRLKRMAEEVARLAIDAKRKRSANMDSAISEWEGDLAYLYRRYYVGHFAFAWPRLG